MMIQEFLQRKLANLVDQYIEFQQLMLMTAEGMIIKNSKIKPKLAEVLSQVMHMPLELISGSISSLTLNKPWEKLFFFLNAPIKIAIQNVHIRTKLPNYVNEDYLLKKKENLIEQMTEGLFNPLEAILHHKHSYINQKLKEYFLSTIILEVKNLCIEIEVDLKYRVTLILRVDTLRFRKQEKKINESERIHLEILGAGLYYRVGGEKQIQFISPTKIEFERTKTEIGRQKKRSSIKNLNIQELQLNVNNLNYGDIARIIYLIKWHNSFDMLPYQLWKIKPFILNECKPKHKFIYCAHLIKHSFKEQHFAKQLILRRQYINHYENLLMNPNEFSPQKKQRLQQMEKMMPIWKIIAYRSFCINIYKGKLLAKKQKRVLELQQANLSEKEKNIGWFKNWSASQKNKDQLQQKFLKKINTIQFVPDDIESIFNVSVDKFKIKLSIVTQYAVQPFILLVGTDCLLRHAELLLQKTWQVQIEIIRCKIQYQKYLGHCQRYRNFISECKEHLNVSRILESGNQNIEEEEDEFDDIGKFLQISFKHNSKVIAINLLPFDIFINHDVIQKFTILLNIENLSKLSKMDKLEENYLDRVNPWQIVEDEKQKIIELKRSQNTENMKLSGSMRRSQSLNPPSTSQSSNKQYNNSVEQLQRNNIDEFQSAPTQKKELFVKTTFNVIIPYDLRLNKSPELVIQVGQITFSKKTQSIEVFLRGILIKYKLPEASDEEEQGYKHLVNYLAPRIQQRVIVRKFNISISLEKHLSFDKSQIVIDSINIELPPQEFLFSLIQLICLHIPKNKQSRAKQYNRRKQSIGEEFIDACENLKEHIAKSMIMSSEKFSKKSIIREKRSKQHKIILKGMNITQKDFQLLVGEISADYNEIGYDQLSLRSHNEKQLKFTVHNVRRLVEAIQNVKLHITKQSIKRGFNSQKAKSLSLLNQIDVQISQINLQVVISLKHIKSKNTPSLKVELNHVSYDNRAQIGVKDIQANLSLFYDEQILNSQRFIQIPFIQPCEVTYRQNSQFNLNKKTLYINTLNINIKPSLFKFLARALKDYHLDEETKCHVTNGTINNIKIKKSHQNYYNDYKHNQKFTTDNYYSEMLLFGMKFQLEFNQHFDDIPKQKIQCIEISQNNFLINMETSPNNYLLQSNIRILNHQDKTLWLKITENTSSIITPEYETTRLQLHQLSLTPKRSFEVDLTQSIKFNEEPINFSGVSKSFSKKNMNYSPQIDKSKGSGKTFNIPLKPKEKVNILIDENDHKYLQIFDQGITFTEISIKELFENNEIVLKSQDDEQCQYLVIRSQISTKEGIKGLLYTFHIYSPIYIVNKTPWDLDYRLSQEQVNIEGDDDDLRRKGRRRSFELIPLKRISVLSSEKIRNLHYNQIQIMKLQLNKCERQFNRLSSLIVSIKEKNNKIKDQFFKETMLITLNDNKRQIQLILTLQFSSNILKIKIYPQFIFVNMTKEIITFKIKEDQITYPQIVLSNLKLDSKEFQSKAQKQRREQFLTHINQYINLSDQKLKERDALKQLFQNFSNNLQIFTGKLQQIDKNNEEKGNKIKRKMIYNASLRNQKQNNLKILGKSSKGYVSDYGSDGQYREELIDFTQQPLQDENIIIYSEQRYMFYKRVLKIQGYFNLIIISPTVHIINKSQAVFFAKSSCEQLVKINKNSHNYIHISRQSIDLQASFEEQISLNQWMKLDLNHLGTVYYSKDMIQHHGSGYQSKQYTLRKRRMKKTPKIFYKILLCKYERGQKILIQESQYPPYSFINNTNYRIKIEEPEEHFIEEFVEKGDMGEYAPRNPYHSPKFRLYVAQKYEYKRLLEFGVDKKQVYQLEKGIIVSVEQYKDKTIVQIKDQRNQNINLSMSTFQRSERYQYNTLLEEIEKFTFQIAQTTITVMNHWNRQLNANFVQKLSLVYEKKNYKDYYKLQISNIEGYDYMDTEPNYIYKRKKKEKKRLGLLHKQKDLQESFLTFQLIINYHKNALIIEKCMIKLDEIVFYLSADLILAYVKNYYHPLYNLLKVHNYYESHKEHKKSDIAAKTFIFESLQWHGTTLKIETRNLFIMETFLNKQYEKWLVKFINWLGDIKPISIDPLKLTYEQITLGKLRRHINFRKKASEVAQQMMDYPLSQLKEIVFFLMGQEDKNIKEKLNLLYNVVKSIEYIVNFTLGLNQNLKSKLKTYNEAFAESYKNDFDIINKMIKFQYCEWKYQKDITSTRLKRKIKRLERYNTRNVILQFDDLKAKVKLAMDNHLSNKLFKKIEHVYRINNDYIFALVQQFVIIYFLTENSWNVIQVESLISFHVKEEELQINFWEQMHTKQKDFHNLELKKSNIRTMNFKNLELEEQHIITIQKLLQENKLTHYY